MRTGLLLALFLGLAPCACGGAESEHASEAGQARLATFNAGLATGYEDDVAERKPAIEAALAKEAAGLDVLCVQEYWDEDHWKNLTSALAAELLYALRRPAEPGPVSCTGAELDPLLACLGKDCAGKTDQELVSCALASCGSHVSALSTGCAACVTQDLSLPLDQIYGTCTSGSSGGSAKDTPALFGGTFDVGLLSRHPFIEQDSKRLDAFMVRVAVLYAKLDTGAGELNVFCTHLTSSIGDWAYGGTHQSWEEENRFEAQQLVDYVNAKAAGGAVVVLGDLNTGPAGATFEADSPASFAVLTDAGLSAPYASQPDASCTLCPDNTHRSPTSTPKLIDHALLRDFAGKAQGSRMLTEPVTLQVNGASVKESLSDHYGLVLELTEQ